MEQPKESVSLEEMKNYCLERCTPAAATHQDVYAVENPGSPLPAIGTGAKGERL